MRCRFHPTRQKGHVLEDVVPHGFALEPASVRQRKTGHPVKFELTEQTREAIDAYMSRFGRRAGNFLFASRGNASRCVSTRHTRAYSQPGQQALDWTREFSAPTPCVAQNMSASCQGLTCDVFAVHIAVPMSVAQPELKG
jgi:hypothetical protein